MSEELCRLLRANANEEWMTIGAKPFALEAAALIEQQAARIAELEARPYHYIGRDGKTVTAASLEDRADAAEAEVKRLRDVLAGIRDYDDPNLPASNKFQAIRNTAFRAIATQESRHD